MVTELGIGIMSQNFVYDSRVYNSPVYFGSSFHLITLYLLLLQLAAQEAEFGYDGGYDGYDDEDDSMVRELKP